MSVEDWARREAATRYPSEHFYGQHDERDAAIGGMQAGIAHAFFALLSDEAVEAAATVLRVKMTTTEETFEDSFSAALHAAIAAVTEGDTE